MSCRTTVSRGQNVECLPAPHISLCKLLLIGEAGYFMKLPKINRKRRSILVAAGSITGALGTIAAAVPFVRYMLPSAKSRSAGAPLEVDLASIDSSTQVTIEWRRKPVWVLHRIPAMLETLSGLYPRHPGLQANSPAMPRTAFALSSQSISSALLCAHIRGVCRIFVLFAPGRPW